MQLYQFEKIYSQMEREFGKIRKGEEETYAMLLLPMEGNVLKIHREFPESNSRRLREAIALVLFDVKGNCSGLCVMMEERAELFSKEMLAFCEEKQFPVICMREDISYAEVLGVINQCILEEQTNVLNQLKLDKILASRTLPQERMKILFSINPGIREYVQAVYIRDERLKITQRKKTGEVRYRENESTIL